jgi:hypothetical protein
MHEFGIREYNRRQQCFSDIGAAAKSRVGIEITPILHCTAKTATQLISTTNGKSGFDFYVCKNKELKKCTSKSPVNPAPGLSFWKPVLPQARESFCNSRQLPRNKKACPAAGQGFLRNDTVVY